MTTTEEPSAPSDEPVPPSDDAVPPSDEAVPPSDEASRARRHRNSWVDLVIVVVLALALAFTLRAFVVQTFYIPSCSMAPTLGIGDRIAVDKLSYDFHAVHRGDVVVFAVPPGEPDKSLQHLVKRVLGLPGETIASTADGAVTIDGKPIAQPWLTSEARANPGQAITPQRIPAGHYFVMGDNRWDSQDSRYFGPIAGSLIVGQADLRIWPLDRIGTLAGGGPSPAFVAGCSLVPSSQIQQPMSVSGHTSFRRTSSRRVPWSPP